MADDQPENHHFVPRYYLRHFAIPSRPGKRPVFIDAYDRQYGTTKRKKAIKGVASERDFYTLPIPVDDDPFFLERGFFQKVDQLGSEMLHDIVTARRILPEQRARLREHLAVQIVRTKWFREYALHNVPKSQNPKLAMRFADAGPPPESTKQEKETFWQETESMITAGWDDALQGPNAIIAMPLGRFPTIRRELEKFATYQLTWFPHTGLLTSDNPIVFRHKESGFLGNPIHIGINNASELWYPITPQIALRLSREPEFSLQNMSLQIPQVLEINNAVARASYRSVLWKPNTIAEHFVSLPPPLTNAQADPSHLDGK